MHADGSFGHLKGASLNRRESLSLGGHQPWPTGVLPLGPPKRYHMSAQEESAALLKELYAQQLANNQVRKLLANNHFRIVTMHSSLTQADHACHYAQQLAKNPARFVTSWQTKR